MSKIDIENNEVLFKRPYVFERKNIYIGTLIECIKPTFDVEDKYGNKYGNKKIKKMGIDNSKSLTGRIIRKMMFAIDKDGTAKDLLYYSPSYEVAGITPKREVDKEYVITNVTNLNKLLCIFTFNETLNSEDIKKVYNLFLGNNKELYLNLAKYGIVTNSNGIMIPSLIDNDNLEILINHIASIRKYSKIPTELGEDKKYTKQRIKTLF